MRATREACIQFSCTAESRRTKVNEWTTVVNSDNLLPCWSGEGLLGTYLEEVDLAKTCDNGNEQWKLSQVEREQYKQELKSGKWCPWQDQGQEWFSSCGFPGPWVV